MAPVLLVRYLLKVTHPDGMFIRTDPVPSGGGRSNRLRMLLTGSWVPAYDVLSLSGGVYAVLVPEQVKNEFCKVSEAHEYNDLTGIGTYARVYSVSSSTFDVERQKIAALEEIARVLRERHDA